jgi:exodeoxyribonuclease V alpha subunit
MLPLFPGYVPVISDEGELSGRVEEVLHADAATGFCVLRVATAEGSVVMAGRGDAATPGDEVSADGSWEVDGRFGRRFAAKRIRAGVPDSAEGIARFVESGGVPGVGAKSARRLLETFGSRLPEVMDAPATLTSAGLSLERARRVSAAWRMRNRHGRLLTLLYAHGMGPAMAARIVEKYGDDTMRIVLSDPYRLSKDVRGVGFRTADRVALSQGRENDAPDRISAAIRHQMSEFGRDGHCAASRRALVGAASKLTLVDADRVEAVVEAMLLQGELVEESIGGRTVIYDLETRECELEIAALIAMRLGDLGISGDPRVSLDSAVRRLGLPPLHPGQEEAVFLGLRHPLCVITGNPGTGKTSTVSVLIECLLAREPGLRIALAAPTGRAAQRLAESTGYPASTLHRLLEWAPEKRGFSKDAENPLELDALVIDESSMLDVWLVRDLLRALPTGARLVVVGDVDQLPSVGAGNVLSDMISSGAVPVARLTHIFRQGAGSAIAEAARKINMGVMPRAEAPKATTDMWGVMVDEPADARAALEKLVLTWVPKMGFDPLRDLQILSPGHQGETGTIALNVFLQPLVNPPVAGESSVEHRNRSFRPRDRVIQVMNDYDRDVFNGDIGHVVFAGVGGDGERVDVDFSGRIVSYDRSDLDGLQHAYCISIHKSQGSEFPVVIVMTTTQHWIMLRRNLIYTGVSRARKLCCVLGQRRALSQAVRSTGGSRLTGLAGRIAALSPSASVQVASLVESSSSSASSPDSGGSASVSVDEDEFF